MAAAPIHLACDRRDSDAFALALWLRIGQGLRALRKGRRLQELAFRFPDYAREVGIGRSRAYELVAFPEALEARPLLREAVRSGRVKYRAAQEVMPLAVGAAEEHWVKKAETETVRALEKEVRRQADPHADEQWFKLVTAIEPEHREVLDEALRISGRLFPEAGPVGRIEAIAQEYLGELPDGRGGDPRGAGDGGLLARGSPEAGRHPPGGVRERDGGFCTVPGCSAHADDAHHIIFRSQGGHPTALSNQTSGCKFHHTCIREAGRRLERTAPDALVWTLDGQPFTGR